MKVTLHAYGITRDYLGGREVEFEWPGPPTVAGLLASLERQYPPLKGLASLRVAINTEYASPETSIGPGDEIVLIPPVSGG
ncbi:MAG: MoaD/ThiS family protein [Bacteroidetes bacterium]|nr:MAG: MoaD/ThiS family protein [Bacteroidota bacterium]